MRDALLIASFVDLVEPVKHSAPKMLGRFHVTESLTCLTAKRLFEGQSFLACNTRIQVPLELDLRRRVELAIDERANVPTDEPTAHCFPAFRARKASSETGSSSTSSPGSSMMPSCTACA